MVSDAVNKDYGVDLGDGLDPLTRERLNRVEADNTRIAYGFAWTSFDGWCRDNGLSPLPAAEATLVRYASHMQTIGRAPATIGQHIGAIRSAHDKAGHPGEPNPTRATGLVRAYRRELARRGEGQRQAIPVTAKALRRMVDTLDLSTMTGRRDQLALVLGFVGMLRRSELVGLHVHDVTVTDEGVTLLVRTSKTDKDSRGRAVPIPPQKHAEVEPVTLTQRWMELVGPGPLLRRITRDDEVTDLPWRAAALRDLVQRAARDAGLPSWERYSAHSLRAGGLTASLRRGTPLGVAARHGGWNPESPVPSRYARVADQWKDNAMRGVL